MALLSVQMVGETWYIRPDGGTRYSAKQHSGQCNGKADAPYSGRGVDQPCAFKDFRYMWDDQTYKGDTTWVMRGGDTVIIEGCASNSNQIRPSSPDCRIGWDSNTGSGAGKTWCWYNPDAPYGCVNPTIPSGTPGHPTRILGKNYAHCSNGNTTNRSALTQLFGGFGVYGVLNLAGAVDVEVECLEITEHNEAVPGRHGTCIRHGSPAYPAGCNNGNPSSASLSDFDQNGILTNNKTSNVLLQDAYIHGHTGSGIYGPIGGALTMNRVFIGFNGFAGWNFDDGRDTPDAPGSSIRASYVTMEGNGCNEQYPIVNSGFPAESCYDSDNGGFGDSWSGQDTELDSFVCDHCRMLYNTKDGFIGPHTQIKELLIENSESVGNMGQQWKWGATPNSRTTFINNLAVGNCNRLSEQIPGAAHSFNRSTRSPGAYLSLYCRAAGDVFSFYSAPNSSVLFANNTAVGYSATMFDFSCQAHGACGSTHFVFRNNIVLGFLNPKYSTGEVPGIFYYGDPSVKLAMDHDVFFNLRSKPCPSLGRSDLICASPEFVNQPPSAIASETQLDNFNFHPSKGSPAIGHGVSVNGVSSDYFGVRRPDPPSIGAVEP